MDQVKLDRMTVGRNVSVALGESPTSQQYFYAGLFNADGVSVCGSLKVTAGSANDGVGLRRLYVGNALIVITGGGNNTCTINDADISGRTRIDLGAGNDHLRLESVISDTAGNLNRPVTFGGAITVRAGAGDDTVFLSDDNESTTYANFGSRIVLWGGAGADALANDGNGFNLTGNFEDFETGDSIP